MAELIANAAGPIVIVSLTDDYDDPNEAPHILTITEAEAAIARLLEAVAAARKAS